MATVQELVNFVTSVTALSSSGVENTYILRWLNDAYQKSVAQTECLQDTFSASLTAGQYEYDIEADLGITDILRFCALSATGSGIESYPLKQVDPLLIIEQRAGLGPATTSSIPTKYAVVGTNKLLLTPDPTDGSTLSGIYVKTPNTLVVGTPGVGEENVPSAFKAPWHYDVLANYAIAMAHEYDNRPDDAANYRNLHEQALANLAAQVVEFGGDNAPQLRTMPYRPSKRYPDVV